MSTNRFSNPIPPLVCLLPPVDAQHRQPGGLLEKLQPKSVVIFRALQLGDMLCAVPAFRALRAALPKAHVALVGLPWALSFTKQVAHYINEFIEFPGFPGLPERKPELHLLPDFLADMQASRFDLAIQMHGNGSLTNPLVKCFGAKFNTGYFVPGAWCPDDVLFLPYPGESPEIWRHLKLMRHLGATEVSDRLEFPIHPPDEQFLDEVLRERNVPLLPRTVCLHPGTNAPWRCWDPGYYAMVGDSLAEMGCSIVLTGTEGERPLVEKVITQMHHLAHDLCGAFPTIGPLAALLRRASLLICGDTGVSHLACAIDCPSVVLFMRSELEGWPPLDRHRHRVVASINGVHPDRVLAECRDLLRLHEESHFTLSA